MALTPATSVDTVQTVGSAGWEVAFDAVAQGVAPGKAVELECDSTSAAAVSCRVNGGSPFRLSVGEKKYREFLAGVRVIEFKGQGGDALVLWDARAGQPMH
jgi:hypothetical protein